MAQQEELLNTIIAKLVNVEAYMHENMATKQELQEVKSELMTHIDGFIKLHETLVVELAAMRAKNERLEARIEKIELKLGMAAV